MVVLMGSALEAILRFGYLAVMSIGVLPLAWPGGLLLVGGSISALILGTKLQKDTFLRAWRWGLSPLVLSAGILLCGVLFWDNDLRGNSPWPETAIHVLLLAHIPLAAVLAFCQPGARLFVLALSAAIFGYSIGAWTMSGMAITGDWL
jgi:hypothetical protein